MLTLKKSAIFMRASTLGYACGKRSYLPMAEGTTPMCSANAVCVTLRSFRSLLSRSPNPSISRHHLSSKFIICLLIHIVNQNFFGKNL